MVIVIDWFLFHVFAFMFFELYIFIVSCGFVFSYLFSLELTAQFDDIAVVLLSIIVCKVWWWMLFSLLFILCWNIWTIILFLISLKYCFHFQLIYDPFFSKERTKKLRLIMCMCICGWASATMHSLLLFSNSLSISGLVYLLVFIVVWLVVRCVYFINFQLYLFPLLLVLHLWSLWFVCLYSVLSRHSVCIFYHWIKRSLHQIVNVF